MNLTPDTNAHTVNPRGRNKEAPWASFDPQTYAEHNYSILRPDDRAIINIVRDFFETYFTTHPELPGEGIDVGTGPNLYPALSLLPWCEKITLFDFSRKNIDWLHKQLANYAASWDPFWRELATGSSYRSVTDPRGLLAKSAQATEGDLFQLPRKQWGIGTMFFVAESISTAADEFEAAVESFTGALRPHSPFAAAFMEESHGYQVADQYFPTYPVNNECVKKSLESHSEFVTITAIGLPAEPLRDGYTGMILACGRTNDISIDKLT